MGQSKVEPQTGITGFAQVLGEQLPVAHAPLHHHPAVRVVIFLVLHPPAARGPFSKNFRLRQALALISARRQKRESIPPASPALAHWNGTKDGPAEKPKDNHGFDHAPKEPRMDAYLAEKHLRLCGIGAKDPVILYTCGNTNRFFLDRKKGQKNYN